MVDAEKSKPLTELIGGLVSDVSGLVRKEIDLAKTEASEKVTQAMGGMEVLVAGLVLIIGAVGVFLSALVSGLAALLVRQGFSLAASNTIAALVVAFVIALIGYALLSKGLSAFRGSNLKLDRTAASVRRDVDVVKERI
ncbi:phage holin family protein [Rhizobium tubonense]|uniref:Nutrient deprivation-induced protein n=1 Tax=Rhizobium tubonense TaxID=484088 RepID=A0A2W4ET30_9HYPH|nr:phage holin family protein [Rhizobium tubonense]PZM16456.1 nutrient deprivation-induced protein [Rhizobium tubonense]